MTGVATAARRRRPPATTWTPTPPTSRRWRQHLDLRDAIHVGHSTGGGEAARYVARHGAGRVAKLVLIGAVPPLMIKTPANPGGIPREVLDGMRKQFAANRAGFYWDFPVPFYGYNRPGAPLSEPVRENWWRQGMMGGAKAQYDCVAAFSETDFTEDLKRIDVPTLVMHGDDDQIVPIADSALLSSKLLRKRHAEGLQGLPAWHVHDPCRRDQSRSARVHPQLSPRPERQADPRSGIGLVSQLRAENVFSPLRLSQLRSSGRRP